MALIRADGVWKRFLLRRDRADSVGQLVARMVPRRSARPRSEPFWALRDVTFEVSPGKSLGIIGSNGSGKSTLLKVLTRTMQPTRGRIQVRGKISALIELGAGFHPDFTGRENVVLNGSILGLRRREIERRMERIIDFADIRAFIDTPVKYYSSGMQARLGFSVAIHVEPEILIIDEVLAVGDEAFQKKCMLRIDEMKRQGISIVLVSHDLGSVERLADEAIWIERGEVRAAGAPRETIRAYVDHVAGSISAPSEVAGPGDWDRPSIPVGDGPVRLIEAFIVQCGKRRDVLDPREPADVICQCYNSTITPIGLHAQVTLRRSDGLPIAELFGQRDGALLTVPPGPQRVVASVAELRVIPGEYEIDAAFLLPDGAVVDGPRPAGHFRVTGRDGGSGVIDAPHSWSVR